jgi:hypothetical protein
MHGSEGGGQKRTGRDTTRNGFWQVEAPNSTSLAPYPTKGAKEKNWNPALKGTERMLAIYDYTTFGMVSTQKLLRRFLQP